MHMQSQVNISLVGQDEKSEIICSQANSVASYQRIANTNEAVHKAVRGPPGQQLSAVQKYIGQVFASFTDGSQVFHCQRVHGPQ